MPLWLQVSLDVLATIATAVAALLAAITIRQAKKQAKTSQDALLLERPVEFRLGLLKEIASWHKHPNTQLAYYEVRARAAMLPRDLIPLTRAHYVDSMNAEAWDRIEKSGGPSSVSAELTLAVATTLALQVSPEHQGSRSKGKRRSREQHDQV